MATQPTNNAVPSESPRDLKFNAGKIDEFVSSLARQYQDRFGSNHYTIEGIRWLAQQAISQYGYVTVDSFQAGANITLPNQILRDTSTGEFYRWDGSLPKNVPANSKPSTTGGIGVGAWLSVGDAALRSQLSDQNGVIKYPEIQMSRWRDERDIRGWGAVGDGVTDDTASIQAAIDDAGLNGEVHIPSHSSGEVTRFKVSSLSNPSGVKFSGPGAIFYYDANGGANQINLHGDMINMHIGQEYLFRPYNRMKNRGVMEIHVFGDSTTAGNNGESDNFKVSPVIGRAFKANGYPMVSINNWGVGGSNITQMEAVGKLSATSDLFIIKYGINDAGLGSGEEKKRLMAFEASLRSKVSEIRSHQYGSMPELAIILMMPNSTNDVLLFGRNSYWYEQLRNIYVKVARDYSCAMFDTYNSMPISSGLAGNAMDNPFGNGIAIHPLDAAMTWVFAKMVDTFFNRTVISNYAQNLFINEPSVTGTPTATALMTGYNYGISAYRALGISGGGTWPLDGTVFTHRSPDEAGIQILYPFSQRGRMLIRVWRVQDGAWSTWSGQEVSLSTQNSWATSSGFSSPNFKVDASGKVTIHAYIQGGTASTGTTILSGLPTYLYPADEGYFPVVNGDGSVGTIGINGTGNIFILNNVKATGVRINVSFWPKGM